MSERLLLSEIDRLRVKCMHCGQTMELALDALGQPFTFSGGKCPLCQHAINPIPHYGTLDERLKDLSQALPALKATKEVELSFTFEDKTP